MTTGQKISEKLKTKSEKWTTSLLIYYCISTIVYSSKSITIHYSLFTEFSSLLCSNIPFISLIIRMYEKEKKVIRFSMIILFLSLMIVYVIWYQIKGNTLQKQIIEEYTQEQQTTLYTPPQDIDEDTQEQYTIEENNNDEEIRTETTITEHMTGRENIKVLSGTSIFYGKVDIIEKLGIKHQYALMDGTGTRFIYLWNPSYDFASIARALKGSIYTMTTEKEILENKLFGNKVVFINLPEYKEKEVIMLIYRRDGIRMIQIAFDIYHQSKSYLKSLFID